MTGGDHHVLSPGRLVLPGPQICDAARSAADRNRLAAVKKERGNTMGQIVKNSSALYRAIREKAEEIIGRNGPMLDGAALAKELGVQDKRTAARWAEEHGVPVSAIGRARRYEARLVAQAIVQSRGMC